MMATMMNDSAAATNAVMAVDRPSRRATRTRSDDDGDDTDTYTDTDNRPLLHSTAATTTEDDEERLEDVDILQSTTTTTTLATAASDRDPGTTRNGSEDTPRRRVTHDRTTTSSAPLSSSSSSSCMAFWGAVANLCSCTLGAGVLSVPQAVAQAGLVGSIILFGVAAVGTVVSIAILVQSCTRYQLYTYESLTEVLYGPWLRRWTEVCIVVFGAGVGIAYLMAAGDILEQANLLVLYNSRSWTMALVWGTILVPLSLCRTMTALQCSSAVGVASIGTLLLAAMVHLVEDDWYNDDSSGNNSSNPPNDMMTMTMTTVWMLDDDNSTHRNDTSSSDGDSGDGGVDWSAMLWPRHGFRSVLTACPIILFAFSCQVNVCAIYEELQVGPTTTPPPPSGRGTGTTTAPDDNENVNNNHSNTNNTPTQEPQTPTPTEDNYSDYYYTRRKQDRMLWVTLVTVMVCCGLYGGIALTTLADFGVDRISRTPNILKAYDTPLRGIMQVAAAAMALAVTMAFPMNMFPARVTLQGLFATTNTTTTTMNIRDREEEEEDEEERTGRGCCARACAWFRKRPDHVESHPNSMLTQALLSAEEEQYDDSEDHSNHGLFAPVQRDPRRDVRIQHQPHEDPSLSLLPYNNRLEQIDETTVHPHHSLEEGNSNNSNTQDRPHNNKNNHHHQVKNPPSQSASQDWLRGPNHSPHDAVPPHQGHDHDPEDTTTTIPPNDSTNITTNTNTTTMMDSNDSFSWWEHVGWTALLTTSVLAVALVAPNISVVFQIIGGTAASALGFCIPGLLGLRLGRDVWLQEQAQQSSQQQAQQSSSSASASLQQRITSTTTTPDEEEPAIASSFRRSSNGGSCCCCTTNNGRVILVASWILLYGGAILGIVTTALTIQQLIWQDD